MKTSEKPDTEQQEGDLEQVHNEEDLNGATNEVLAAHVVAYRHLGINKKHAKNCMKVLMQRKSNGETFDYEAYIKEKLAEAPSPTLDAKSKGILKQIFNMTLKNQ